MSLGPVMLDLAGPELDPEDRELLMHPAVGGVILFDRNYREPTKLGALVNEIHGLREPRLLVAVDQEGGRVQRFRSSFTRLPPPATLGEGFEADAGASLGRAERFGWLMAMELRSAGIDFSFAPVLDLGGGRSTVIGNRALHADPEIVASLGRAMMKGMRAAGMSAVGKHFPGHGTVEADSHLTLPVDERDLETIRRTDLVAFERLVHFGIPAIMPAHVVYPLVDPLPACQSPFWLKGVLREELGFTGAVFSDDLSMAAAAVTENVVERCETALDAGCDVVLVCNDRPAAVNVLDGLRNYESALRGARLARMHGRDGMPRDRLRGDARYQGTVAEITALDVTPELDLGDDTLL